MSNKNLFKEAIADAKAVREAALANAKAALEEALTPKLQSMLAAKLNEMEYEEEEELEEMSKMKDDEEMEEGFSSIVHDDDPDNPDFHYEEGLEEDFDLSEILAELEDEDEKSIKEAKEEGEEEEETEETEEEEAEEVADMTVEDLKALIKDLISQEMGGEGEEEAGEEMSMDMGSEEGGEESSDEIDLEELLAELDAMNEGDEEEELEEAKKAMKTMKDKKMKSKKQELDEIDLGKIGAGIKRMVTGDKECAAEAEKVDSSKPGNYYGPSAVAKSDEWWAAFNACRKAKGRSAITKHTAGQAFGVKETKEELEEAIDTINTLRNELNEVNLLNAKLLYVNKIFRAKNLSESQKLQVIASFDKATTAKEAKVVYESLNATLTASAPKKQIKESLGFASKAAGVAPKKAIVESNDVITRMQKLANIIK